MPRLNIYIPDDLHELAASLRGSKNLSAICAKALREELESADAFRSPGPLIDRLRGPSELERSLAHKFGLHDVVCSAAPEDPSQLRAVLGEVAAAYLDRNLVDGSVLGIAGGRQTWCVVRSIAPRRLKVTLAAVGVALNDPKVLHAHPNTLVTMLSLLYAPGAEAHLIGSSGFSGLWSPPKRAPDGPRHFFVASCASFEPHSPFAQLLGEAACRELSDAEAVGDFAGVFFDRQGELLLPPRLEREASLLQPAELKGLAQRQSARVVLVAGGPDKLPMIRAILKAGLCNVLITDAPTAKAL